MGRRTVLGIPAGRVLNEEKQTEERDPHSEFIIALLCSVARDFPFPSPRAQKKAGCVLWQSGNRQVEFRQARMTERSTTFRNSRISPVTEFWREPTPAAVSAFRQDRRNAS
jgi:hypothetical protein